jgi:hypothetical protein
MTDVFVRVFATNGIRLGFAISTIARWSMEPDARLHLIVCKDGMRDSSWYAHELHFLPSEDFAKRSIEMIERLAEGDIYAGSDDDMLIYGKGFLAKGLEIMRRHPEYGMLCASPTNEGVIPPDAPKVEVAPSWSVGGPAFVRKGLLTEFPSINNSEYAGFMDHQMNQKGFKQGYITDLKYLHLGHRYSVTNPAFCDGV